MTDPTTAAALRLLLAELGPEWRYAGSVAVDSGGLLLIDPAAEPPPPLPIAAGTLLYFPSKKSPINEPNRLSFKLDA